MDIKTTHLHFIDNQARIEVLSVIRERTALPLIGIHETILQQTENKFKQGSHPRERRRESGKKKAELYRAYTIEEAEKAGILREGLGEDKEYLVSSIALEEDEFIHLKHGVITDIRGLIRPCRLDNASGKKLTHRTTKSMKAFQTNGLFISPQNSFQFEEKESENEIIHYTLEFYAYLGTDRSRLSEKEPIDSFLIPTGDDTPPFLYVSLSDKSVQLQFAGDSHYDPTHLFRNKRNTGKQTGNETN